MFRNTLQRIYKLNPSITKSVDSINFNSLSLNGQVLSQVSTQRKLSTTPSLCKVEDKKQMLASMPVKDEGTQGEKLIDIDSIVGDKSFKRFPDLDTPKQLFNDTIFDELPICNIKVSPNNTILSITDFKGRIQFVRSCGVEGFKNTRKGTNIAAQATAISISTKAVDRGYKAVRVRVRGIGPGRMSAIKGLQMGGLDIVSITDNTHVSWNPPRPRKQKKL